MILSYIPKINLDDTYQQEDQIARRIKESLATVMANFGYSIENALVTKIVPADAVVKAMNDSNAARREKVATEARAETNKITLVRQEALAGQGVARERKAIVDGLRDSVLNFEEGVQGVNPHEVMALLMMTQYFDALPDIGAQSNTILLPHSPPGSVRPLHAVAQCHYRRKAGRREEYGELTFSQRLKAGDSYGTKRMMRLVLLRIPCSTRSPMTGRSQGY